MRRRAATVARLLERERELEQLEAAVAAALGGAGSIVALEGEAGIGKTSLLLHAGRRASDAGMRVLRARGGELEREFAYGIVRQLFEAALTSAPPEDRERWLTGAAAMAAPVLSASATGIGSDPDLSSFLHGLYWLSANLSVEQPLLITIDDAQWADGASIAFLCYLARRVDELALLIVYASRVGEGASDVLPAVAEPELVSSVLRPAVLSHAASAQLIEALLDRPGSPSFARACHEVTNGNPFLLTELLRALEADDIAPEDANLSRLELIAPTTVARATLARLRHLGPHASRLASAIAVFGWSADLRHAAALAELEVDDAAQAADALAMAEILREGRPLEFIHPLIRTTIYNEIAEGSRAASHKAAARLLVRDGVDDAAVAPHLLSTEPDGDPWVVERLLAAAQDVLEHGAPDAACAYLERARREPPPPELRLQLLLRLGLAELRLARPAAISHLRSVLAETPDPQIYFEATQDLMWALAYRNRIEDAVQLGNDVISGALRQNEELTLRMEGAIFFIAQFAPASTKKALQPLLRYEGRLTGQTAGERLMLACLAFATAHCGDSATATAELATAALSDGKLLADHQSRSPGIFMAAWALLQADRLSEAEHCFDLTIEDARRQGSTGAFASRVASRCQVLVRQGRIAQAEAEAGSVLSASGPNAIARSMLLSCLLTTMLERSAPRTWDISLSEYGIDGDLSAMPMAGMLLFARGQLRLAAGDAHAALRDFEQWRALDERAGIDPGGAPSRACRALAHSQLGDHDAAHALAGEALDRARRWDTPSALAFALRTAGLVYGGDDGIELLHQSVDVVEYSPARYEHAQSLAEYGAALRRAGHRRDAREPLRRALDIADQCGASRLASRARQELIAAGARPRRAALSGRDALTPSERRVAQLAADGLSNREVAQALFVTVRTIESHLTQAYMKLHIGSRDQLAEAIRDTTVVTRPQM